MTDYELQRLLGVLESNSGCGSFCILVAGVAATLFIVLNPEHAKQIFDFIFYQ
jgi:hypothetical protein